MKTIVKLLCFAVMATTVTAQAADYKPLLEEGKSWIMGYVHTAGNGLPDCPSMMRYYHLREYKIDGVKVIDDVEYKCLTVNNYPGGSRISGTYYLHEEDGVISMYDVHKTDDHIQPVMRFDVVEGDSIFRYTTVEPINGENVSKDVYYHPSEIKTIVSADGVERREIVLGNSSWVEGIGASNCYSLLCPMIGNAWSGGYYFIECRKDGKTIFTNKDFANPILYGLQTARTITPGKSWTMARGTEVFTVTVDHDTIIGNMEFMALKSSEGKEYIVAEENGRVYAFLDQYGEVNPGENAFMITNTHDSYIIRQDAATATVLNDERWNRQQSANQLSVGERTFNEYLFENASGEVVGSWVDGVGAPDSRSWAVVMPEDFQTLRMIDCRQDGEVIFSAEDFTYQSGIREVNADAARSSAAYDLQGRRVANPTRGLYILNGKKQLIR